MSKAYYMNKVDMGTVLMQALDMLKDQPSEVRYSVISAMLHQAHKNGEGEIRYAVKEEVKFDSAIVGSTLIESGNHLLLWAENGQISWRWFDSEASARARRNAVEGTPYLMDKVALYIEWSKTRTRMEKWT